MRVREVMVMKGLYKGVGMKVREVMVMKGLYKGVVVKVGEVMVLKGLYKGGGDEGRGSDEGTVGGDGDEGRGNDGDEGTVQGGDGEGRGIGDSAPTLRGPRRVREASIRRLSYQESDDDIGWQTDSDAGSDFQLSDIDTHNDFLGFEEREGLLESDESEEEEISFDDGSCRVPSSRRSRRSRWSRAGRRRVLPRRRGVRGDVAMVIYSHGRISQPMK